MSPRQKKLSKKEIRETGRWSAAFRAGGRKIDFCYSRLVIGNLTFYRQVMRAATAEAILDATGHTAGIGGLSCEDNWRCHGSDQQEKRRTKCAQSC
jgi:hypothetical protein